MGKIVIKKKISLDYLGEDYKGGHITFKSLSVKDVQEKMDAIEQASDDGKKAIGIMVGILQDNFIDGVFKSDGEDVNLSKEDIDEFDPESVTRFFKVLAGQDGDPKV